MRLWHKDLIPVLPRQQLLGQWRECCLIAKELHNNSLNHILVNKIKDFPIQHFIRYVDLVIQEMTFRGYRIDSTKCTRYFENIKSKKINNNDIFKEWHNNTYLIQCLFNLQEKFCCGGITEDEWGLIKNFITHNSSTWEYNSIIDRLLKFI